MASTTTTTSSSPNPAPLKLFLGCPPLPKHQFSSFVNKLDAMLRFNNVPYTREEGSVPNAPRGKVPYVQFPSSPDLVGDSHLIIQQLVRDGTMPDPSAGLTPLQRAQEVAMRALVEDRIYFINVHECWLIPSNYYLMRDVGPLATLAYPLRLLLGQFVHTKLRLTLHGQGTSRFTPAERRDMLAEGLDAISGLVELNRPESDGKAGDGAGKEVYWTLGSEHATEFDATLFGFMAAVLVSPAAGEVKQAVRSYPVLVDWAGRIHETYYANFEKWDD